MATSSLKDNVFNSQEKAENPNTDTNSKDANVSSTKFTSEQKIVSAVWIHEREFNLHSIEKIKQNFKTRFGIEAPDLSVLLMWEKKLFEDGYIDKEEHILADREMSDEESDEDDGSEDDNSQEESSD